MDQSPDRTPRRGGGGWRVSAPYFAGAPPGFKNDETQAGQGLGFGVEQANGFGLQVDDSTLRWGQYEARRRARRERPGSCLLAEIEQ